MPTALERLKTRRDQLNAQIQAVEARERTAERKRDLRRKIFVGAYYLDKAQKENNYDDLVQALEAYLTRNSDRQLFNLPELTETTEQETVA